MKKLYILKILIFTLILVKCHNSSFKGWKTVVDEEGNVTLMDPMLQEFLSSNKPYPTQESLDDILERTTRVRLMNSGMSGSELALFCRNESIQDSILLDTSDEEQIAIFRDLFKIIEDTSSCVHCMCLGWPTFELYSGDQLISRIGMQHGSGIRWIKWKCDASLKDNVLLLDWLAANSAPQPKEDYEADLAYSAKRQRIYERWLDATPDCLRSRWAEIKWWASASEPTQETINDLSSLLEKNIPDSKEQTLILFEWYGHGEGPWNGVPMHEYTPAHMLAQIGMPDILMALDGVILTDAQKEGVSRFFCMGGTSVVKRWAGWKTEYRDVLRAPKELKKLIWEHVLNQMDYEKKCLMENSLLFKEYIEQDK